MTAASACTIALRAPPAPCGHSRSTLSQQKRRSSSNTVSIRQAPRCRWTTEAAQSTPSLSSSWIASSLVIGALSTALHVHAADMEFNDRQKEAICGTAESPKILKTAFARKLCGKVTEEDVRAKEVEAKKLEQQKKLLREKVFAAFS